MDLSQRTNWHMQQRLTARRSAVYSVRSQALGSFPRTRQANSRTQTSARFYGATIRNRCAPGPSFWVLPFSGGRGESCARQLTGQPAVNRVYGKPFFEYLADCPDDAAVFNAAMTAGSEMSVPLILAAYDFSRFERIVDVGGGHGALLDAILSANPRVRGVLYDLPPVVASAAAPRSEGVAARREVFGGDFFEAVPEGADMYILKGVIHDWNDDDALKILKNCRRAIKRDGRLLLIEEVLKPSSQPDPGREFMDVLMLTLVGGRERTESAFRALLQEAGFSLTCVIPTGWASSIIESQPT